MQIHRIVFIFALALNVGWAAAAQDRRPIPYPILPSEGFETAVDRGFRTHEGRPGPQHWTNTADYDIEAVLDPQTNVLFGKQTVVYQQNGPFVLDRIFVHLYQNLHEEGAIRNRPQQVTGGVDLRSVSVNGAQVQETPDGLGYSVDGTTAVIRLDEPIGWGDSVELGFEWSFEVPEAGAPRMGQDGEVYFLGYWYPQIAVFDDVEGWSPDPYMGEGEFYMGFGDYDVSITVPDDWLLSATGKLTNPEEVYSTQTMQRLEARPADGSVTSIVSEGDLSARSATATSTSGTHTWRFRAESVRDFAFGGSDAYVWDSAVVTLPDGGHTDVHAMYRPRFDAWSDAAEFGVFSIRFMSERFIDYPWPHMSILEGIIGGGMEYPMITLIGSNRTPRSLFGTTLHEIVHMWFPMLVNQNEKAFTWMDEGLTSFLTAEGTGEYWDDETVFTPEGQYYYRFAGMDFEVPSVRHADRFPLGLPSRAVAHYSKPAVAFNTLRHILGEDLFWQALREYFDRWKYRHPYPYDMFNTFNDVAGEDLSWFWRSMFYETWVHDLALADVEISEQAVRVLVGDLGLVPMPATVRVTYSDGMTIEQTIPVDVWLDGEREVLLEFQGGKVDLVEVDPDWHLPDVDRSNNVWNAVLPEIGE